MAYNLYINIYTNQTKDNHYLMLGYLHVATFINFFLSLYYYYYLLFLQILYFYEIDTILSKESEVLPLKNNFVYESLTKKMKIINSATLILVARVSRHFCV